MCEVLRNRYQKAVKISMLPQAHCLGRAKDSDILTRILSKKRVDLIGTSTISLSHRRLCAPFLMVKKGQYLLTEACSLVDDN